MYKLKVGFSYHKKSLTSWLIKTWMGKKFSHTYLHFKLEEFNQFTVFQAIGTGLQFVSDVNFLKENTVVREFSINISKDQYLRILNKCHEASGKKYGYLQNIGIVLSTIFRLKKNPFPRNENCSEWVAECLVELDPEAFSEYEDLNLIRPDHVYNYLEKKYNNNNGTTK